MNLDVLGDRALSSKLPWRCLISLNAAILGVTGVTVWSIWQLRVARKNAQMATSGDSEMLSVTALE